MTDRSRGAVTVSATRIGRTDLGHGSAIVDDDALTIVIRGPSGDRPIRVPLAMLDGAVLSKARRRAHRSSARRNAHHARVAGIDAAARGSRSPLSRAPRAHARAADARLSTRPECARDGAPRINSASSRRSCRRVEPPVRRRRRRRSSRAFDATALSTALDRDAPRIREGAVRRRRVRRAAHSTRS